MPTPWPPATDLASLTYIIFHRKRIDNQLEILTNLNMASKQYVVSTQLLISMCLVNPEFYYQHQVPFKREMDWN